VVIHGKLHAVYARGNNIGTVRKEKNPPEIFAPQAYANKS